MKVSADIRSIAKELLERYKKEIEDTGHKASGELQNSASYKCIINGTALEVWFSLPEYWFYLENGTAPHFPPVSAIENWITVKRIVPNAANNRIPTTKQLAFVIARSISKKGTPATKLLQKTIDSSEDLIELMIEKLTELIEEQLNEEKS